MNSTDFVELNESGLGAIDERQYETAVDLYRRAIHFLNEERTAVPQVLPAADVADAQPPPPFYHVYFIPLEITDEMPLLKEDTASQDGHFTIYEVAFLIDFRDVRYAYAFAITTILYNMGLALHVDALTRPSRVRLMQAKAIYEKALDFFDSTGRCLITQTRPGHRRFLFFAIANNYGHCCSLLSDGNGIQRAQQLLSTLWEDPFSFHALGAEDGPFFKMSFLMGVLKGMTPPPAAVA